MYLHLLSDSILLFSVGFVIRNCFQFITKSEKIFWSCFLVPVALNAVLDVLQLVTHHDYTFLVTLSQQSMAVVGGVGIIAGTWYLLMGSSMHLTGVFAIVVASVVLLWTIINFQSGIMAVIFQPFCIIFALMIASWGLINRRRSALWLVLAFMVLAVSLKKNLIHLQIGTLELQHYLVALSILLIGYALRSKNLLLFR